MPKSVSTPPRLERPHRVIRLPYRYRVEDSPCPLRRAPDANGLRRYAAIPTLALRGPQFHRGLTREQVNPGETSNADVAGGSRSAPVRSDSSGIPDHAILLGESASENSRTTIERRQHQLLQEKDARIQELKSHIRRLERSERRLKAQTIQNRDTLANKDAELGETRRALQTAEETLEGKEESLQELIREVHHYQGWWLNEYYCLKVALKLARNKKDPGVQAMKEASHARFMKWSVSHQS